MSIGKIFQETLNLTTAKEYVGHWNKGRQHKKYDKWFGKDASGRPATRVYIIKKNGKPLSEKDLKNSVDERVVLTGWKKIESILLGGDKRGVRYEMIWNTDAKGNRTTPTGKCKVMGEKLKTGQQGLRIGKVLQKIDPSAMKLLNSLLDSTSKELKISSDDLLVVISRNPLDIAGMSTDRDWQSCTAIKGGGITPREYHTHVAEWSVERYIEEGCLIAYIIKYDDMKNITHPIGRKLIIPYVNREGERCLVINHKKYGTWDSQANEIVNHWLDSHQGSIDSFGRLTIIDDIYNDDNEEVLNDDDTTEEEKAFYEVFNGKNGFEISWTYGTGRVIVYGDVKLDRYDLDNLQMGGGKIEWECAGNFVCSHCNIDGHFSHHNMPIDINGEFDCSYNEIVGNLEGIPSGITDKFNCSHNSLDSLEGGPSQKSYNHYGSYVVDIDEYNCSYNKLIDLDGAPKIVGDFDCSYNNLHDLTGGPIIVDGDFNCSNNPLRSFDGAPEQIRGKFIYTKSPFVKDEDIPVYENGRKIIKPIKSL